MADGLLAISAFEKASACGQFVDVWRDGILRAVATEFGAKIVDGNEEDVRFARRGRDWNELDQEEAEEWANWEEHGRFGNFVRRGLLACSIQG